MLISQSHEHKETHKERDTNQSHKTTSAVGAAGIKPLARGPGLCHVLNNVTRRPQMFHHVKHIRSSCVHMSSLCCVSPPASSHRQHIRELETLLSDLDSEDPLYFLWRVNVITLEYLQTFST
ncbi:unnamed protein product [Pleuronectes platessa]|uniref:Uncharacterized protein n=1 Tax=Pleuronectes platessa TaxID=8262 RepID=A0A9N7ZDR2_PLEPL|nr:unnamed protein product [Pleuronectes platessa]